MSFLAYLLCLHTNTADFALLEADPPVYCEKERERVEKCRRGEYRSRENKKREERKRVTNGKGEKGEGKTIRG